MKRSTPTLLLALLLMLSPLASARGPGASGELAPLMETARVEGRASGTLSGVGIDEPVEVTVQRLYQLRDAGCARIRVSLDQRGVMLPGETHPRDRHAEFAMNWCESGRPPASGEGTRPAEGEGRR